MEDQPLVARRVLEGEAAGACAREAGETCARPERGGDQSAGGRAIRARSGASRSVQGSAAYGALQITLEGAIDAPQDPGPAMRVLFAGTRNARARCHQSAVLQVL